MAGVSGIVLCKNGAAGTYTAPIQVGGQYALMITGTFGSVQMSVIDTFGNSIPYGSAITAAGYVLLQLPPGTLKMVATGGSAYYASVVSVVTNTNR